MLKIPNVVYKTLYLLVHHLYSLFLMVSGVFGEKSACKNTTVPRKIPEHLTVLLGHEKPSIVDLADLVVWSLSAGISFISFYDYKGALKKEEDKFRSAVDRKKQPQHHVIWHDRHNVKQSNGYKNKIHIKLLDGCDSKQTIVDLCKTIASDLTDFGVANLDRALSDRYEFPDPDLAVCCGETISLYGYPPWQVRVTEFLTVHSHHRLTIDRFLQILDRFSRCQQRFGK